MRAAGDGEDAGTSPLEAASASWLAAQRAAFDLVREATDLPPGEVERAEGYRWVTRLAALVQTWFVEQADPTRPELFQLQDDHRKLLVDNPDVRYLFAPLDATSSYRLRGTRGQAAYVGLTFGTPIGRGAVGGRTGTTFQSHLDAYVLGPHGEVDILLRPRDGDPADAPPGPAGNVIELPPETGQLAVRETFFDRRHDRPSELRLERVQPLPAPRLDAEGLATSLEAAALVLQFVAATARTMWADSGSHVNHLGGVAGSAHVAAQEDEVRTHSNAEMDYHGGRFSLGEDEALMVTVHPPTGDFLYWGLTIASPWMESYDNRYATSCLNNRSARRSADGTWRLVVAGRDPGVDNWLDTAGRPQGYMIVRWVLADDPPHPTCQVVPIDSLLAQDSEAQTSGAQTSEGTPKRSW